MEKFLLTLLLHGRDCVVGGFGSLLRLGSAALFVILWSCFLCLTSISCLMYVLPSLGAAGAAVHYSGYTPGLFIFGLFGIFTVWMYGNFWIIGKLFIVGGFLFSLNHARVVVLMAMVYTLYYVKVHVGWLGVFLAISLSLISNDLCKNLLQGCDNMTQGTHFEEHEESEPVIEDVDLSWDCKYSVPINEAKNLHSCKSSGKQSTTSNFLNTQSESSTNRVVKEDTGSVDEMKRIMNSVDHYEALGLPRHKNIDAILLKKEYWKKAKLVHPDKNMGSPLASESFKKLQCAYEVLLDSMKKKDYDDQLRKEDSRSVCQKSNGTSQQDSMDYCSEESRSIQCTQCSNSHIWICTTRTKAKARWCQDCCQYHQAKDGDGWHECGYVFERSQKVEIPRAFVCAESMIFDVSEWAICQGMFCRRPNTHRPSFCVNMVLSEKETQRSDPGRFRWDLAAVMMGEGEEVLEMSVRQALASELLSETSPHKKNWSPFKLHPKNVKKQWWKSL